jgi:hypothetical protein
MWAHKSETVARAPTQMVHAVALEGSMYRIGFMINRIGFMIDLECSMSLNTVPVKIMWQLMLRLKHTNMAVIVC